MKIVFFGTPEYVVPIVDKLHKTFRSKDGEGVVAVVTQAPKPAGRKKELKYSEVDHWTHRKDIPKFHSASDFLKKEIEVDVGVLAAYGEIIPKNVIEYFPKGILNVHPSDLPKYRGASPVQATILTESIAAISIIKMDQQLDHGPIVTKFNEDIKNDDTTGSLTERLFARSADVLCELMPAYISDKVTTTSQNHKKATLTKLIKKDYAFLDIKHLKHALDGKKSEGKIKIRFIKDSYLPATIYNLHNFIRAMQPWPVAWTYISAENRKNEKTKKRLKIISAHVDKLVPSAYCLVPDIVQLEGKNPVTWKQFKQAYPKFLSA